MMLNFVNAAINLLFVYKCSCKQTQLANLEKLLQFFGFLQKTTVPSERFWTSQIGTNPTGHRYNWTAIKKDVSY